MRSERNEDLCHNLFVVLCTEFSKTLYIIDRTRIITESSEESAEREKERQQAEEENNNTRQHEHRTHEYME